MATAREKVGMEKQIVAGNRREFGQALWTFDSRRWAAGEARAEESA
jgi:hypothetical protein